MRRGARRKRIEVEAPTASAPALPPLDETTFQQLLEAAYVIQEQREAQAVPGPEKLPPPVLDKPAEVLPTDNRSLDAAEVLALIVETQEQLRSQVRDLPTAGKLIAKRLEQVTNAAGVAIAVIHGDHLEFCAATGVLSSLAGSTAPVGEGLPELLHANSWSSVELAIRHDARCPIVFPIFHEGRTTGLLHLSFPSTDTLEEHQIRTCQVMAGLMGEAINRVSELQWKQTLAAERTTMMEILERLRPQLERLASESKGAPGGKPETVGAPDFFPSSIREEEFEPPVPQSFSAADVVSSPADADHACRQCGFHMKEDEIFCGQCGAPQLDLTEPLPDLKEKHSLTPPLESSNPVPPVPNVSKHTDIADNAPDGRDVPLPASLEQALAHLPARDVVDRFRPRFHPLIDESTTVPLEPEINGIPRDTALRDGSITLESPEPPTPTQVAPEPAKAESDAAGMSEAQLEAPPAMEKAAEAKTVSEVSTGAGQKGAAKSPWASASQAREWLQSLQNANSPGRVWLNKHRADLWVVVSLVLLLLAVSGLGSRSAIYGAAQSRVVQPSLTLFERFLVALDLAQPPPTPVYLGNPNVRVWVDLHTALYYCPGSELYGKTPEGKFTSQRDAQIDEFEPAARAYCQ